MLTTASAGAALIGPGSAPSGFVTRLRSLTEAEAFIAAGIPLVASVSFSEGELKGAGYATNGHLMVVVGVTEAGDVVCNDPASHVVPDNGPGAGDLRPRAVRERLGPTGGIVYVIHPDHVALPPAPADEPNW